MAEDGEGVMAGRKKMAGCRGVSGNHVTGGREKMARFSITFRIVFFGF